LVQTPPMDARRRRVLLLVCACISSLASAAQASPVDPSYLRIVGNQSSRGGAVPQLIVIHATTDPNATTGPVFRDRPGIRDLEHLGNWFAKPRSQVASHV